MFRVAHQTGLNSEQSFGERIFKRLVSRRRTPSKKSFGLTKSNHRMAI